jgi:hypothetical protein
MYSPENRHPRTHPGQLCEGALGDIFEHDEGRPHENPQDFGQSQKINLLKRCVLEPEFDVKISVYVP